MAGRLTCLDVFSGRRTRLDFGLLRRQTCLSRRRAFKLSVVSCSRDPHSLPRARPGFAPAEVFRSWDGGALGSLPCGPQAVAFALALAPSPGALSCGKVRATEGGYFQEGPLLVGQAQPPSEHVGCLEARMAQRREGCS